MSLREWFDYLTGRFWQEKQWAIPNRWVLQIFEAKAAQNGNLVRRKKSNVRKYASYKMLLAEVKRRKFHLFETGNQYVILCHDGDLRLVC